MDNKSQSILKKRAEMLSKAIVADDLTKDYIELLIFRLAKEQYAMETKYIKEITPLKTYTPLPCTPSFIFGLINLHRRIITIVDLKNLFSLPINSQELDKQHLIVIGHLDKEFAILCDSFSEIRKIPLETIFPPLPSLTGIKLTFLKGITSDQVIILDGDGLISSKELIVDEQVEI